MTSSLKASQGIPIGTANELSIANHSFSVLVWINLDQHNLIDQGDNTIIGSRHGIPHQCIHLIVRNGHPYMGFYCNDTESPEIIPIKQWHHLAFVYDMAAQSQSIFLNGKLSVREFNRPALQGNALILISEYAGGRPLNGR